MTDVRIEQQGQYGTFLETIPDAAVLVDQRGTIICVNTQVQGLLGHLPGDLIGHQATSLIPAALLTEHRRQVAGHLASPRGRPLATRASLDVKHRDGYELPVAVSLTLEQLGQNSITLCVVRDMRIHGALDSAVRLHEDQYRNLVEQASEVFYVVELDTALASDPLRGRFIYVSPQARALTGYTSEMLLNKSDLWAQLIAPNDLPHVASVTAEMLSSGTSKTRRYRIRHHETNAYRWVEDRIVPRFDSDWRVSGYQGVIRDVTEGWSHQQELQAVTGLAKALRDCPTKDALVRGLLDGTFEAIDANGAAIAILDEPAGEVVFEFGRGVLSEWTGRRLPVSASVSATVINTGVPWVSNRAVDSRDLSQHDLPANVLAYASIPLHARGQALGSLVVTKASSYADHEVQILQAIGEMGAVAFQRQTLHDELVLNAAALVETCEHTIEGWARALDMRDRITEGHTRRVTALTMALARRIGVAEEQWPHIRRGAMLHDIGKMGVPDHILRKPGPLTEEEQAVMRKHVEYGYAMLAPIEFLQPALPIPCYHHERWDGTGYPYGLAGDSIPLAARIFAVADVYDAITSERIYAPAESRAAALDFIRANSGSHFDPAIAEAFLSLEQPADGEGQIDG